MSLIKIAKKSLYVLAGTCDRSGVTEDISTDLIGQWKAGDDSKGKISVREYFGSKTQLSGEIRPVLPLEPISEVEHDIVKEEQTLGDMTSSSDTAATESRINNCSSKSLQP